MTDLKNYRKLMLVSGFVGMAAYWGNPQMMIIKALVIGIMTSSCSLINALNRFRKRRKSRYKIKTAEHQPAVFANRTTN